MAWKRGRGAVVPMPARGSTRYPGENPLLTQCEPPSKNPDDFAPGQRVTRTYLEKLSIVPDTKFLGIELGRYSHLLRCNF